MTIIIQEPEKVEYFKTPSNLLKMNKIFKDLGFKKVIICDDQTKVERQLPMKEMTLFIMTRAQERWELEDYHKVREQHKIANDRTIPIATTQTPSLCTETLTFKDRNETQVIYLAGYNQSSNAVYMYLSLDSAHDYNVPMESSIISWLLDLFSEWILKIKLKTVKIDEFGIIVAKFQDGLKKNIQTQKNNVKSYMQSMEDYSRSINDYANRCRLADITIEGSMEALKNSEKAIKQQLKDLKSLNFIADMKLDKNGITYTDKNIVIKHAGKELPMGDFTINIGFDSIKISSNKWIQYGDAKSSSRYYHPHNNGSSWCFGTWNVKFTELRTAYKFKELALLLHMYLQSYNPEDKYRNIKYFIDAYLDNKHDSYTYPDGVGYDYYNKKKIVVPDGFLQTPILRTASTGRGFI